MGELRSSRPVGEREVGVGTWCLLGLYRKTLRKTKGNSQVQQRLVQFMNVPNSHRGNSSYVQLADKKM